MTPDHLQECLTLSELQAEQPVKKTTTTQQHKKYLDQMESQTKWLHICAIQQYANSWKYSWSPCTLLQIWWEAIMIPVS